MAQMGHTPRRGYCAVVKDTSFDGRTNAFHDLVEKGEENEVGRSVLLPRPAIVPCGVVIRYCESLYNSTQVIRQLEAGADVNQRDAGRGGEH